MKWHARFVFLGLATITLGTSAPARAQSDSEELMRPQLVEHLFKVRISGQFGDLGASPVAGQGFVKPGSGTESRFVESPHSFSTGRFELRVGIGNWSGSYERGFGSASSSSAVEPGANGDLFLGVNSRGHNGRIFSGFAAEEEIAVEYDSNWLKLARELWSGEGSYFSVYGYYETSRLDYRSRWNVSRFPDTRSETEHRLSWDSFGVGMDAPLTLFSVGDVDILINPEGWIGRGDFDYEASQQVLNPPNPDDDFSAVDHVTRTAWGSQLRGIVRVWPTRRASVDFYGGVRISRMPTFTQPNGNELQQGLSNGLDFVNPREYFLGARLRF